ncbi:hypothetical protein HDV06_004620 [Boothiomyces sp. JEL0866]|nr:hypothetical protein HDV06_004620 [Boothiomyces sp. JEL0866]
MAQNSTGEMSNNDVLDQQESVNEQNSKVLDPISKILESKPRPNNERVESLPSILKKATSIQVLEKQSTPAHHKSKATINLPFGNFPKSKLVMPYEDDEEEVLDINEHDPIMKNKFEEPNQNYYPEKGSNSNSRKGSGIFGRGKSDDNISNHSSVNSQGKLVKTIYNQLIKIYEMYHIAFTLAGHMLFVSTNSILKVIHKWILASQLASHGCTLNALASGVLSSSAPGYQIRTCIKFIGFAVPVLISITAYFFEWTELSSVVTTDACIPATYPDPSNIIPDIGNFLQGDTDLALVYSYGIPLEDGIVGGWSAWPLINPYSQFSLEGNGVGYAIGVECFQAYAASTSSQGTSFFLTSSTQFQNSIYGTMKVYLPQGSMILDSENIDDVNGYMQECTFNIQFFEADTINSFQSDEWQMVAVQNILSVKVGNATVTLDTNKNRYVREFLQYTNSDKWNLANYYHPIVDLIFNSTTYYSSQGASFCNLLQWATLPDGYYHDSIMWKGIAAALGTAGITDLILAHYLVLQYDSTQTATCEYFAYHGAGYLYGHPTLITAVQVIVIILGAGVLLHIWWIYLIFGLDTATSLASHTLNSNVRFAHDIHKHGDKIFAGSVSTLESFDEDLLKKIGENKVYYGSTFESMNDDVPQLLLGPKKQIITIKKLLQRRKAAQITPIDEFEKE